MRRIGCGSLRELYGDSDSKSFAAVIDLYGSVDITDFKKKCVEFTSKNSLLRV